MSTHMKLYLFGDQTFEIQPHLQNLAQKKSNLFLTDFLERIYNAIRLEFYKLPAQVRDELPRFTCPEDLVLHDPKQKTCIALDMAMTTTYHLCTFMSQEESVGYGSPSRSIVLGLCTGAFAAAAVSCSRSTSELIPMAVDAVLAAFRTGMLVADVATRLNQSQDADKTWTILVPGTKASLAVEQFCESSNLPSTSKPYVSAHAPNGIAVSGPPSSLESLVSSPSFKGLTYKSIRINGPYHASHLYSEMDVQSVLSDSPRAKHFGCLQNLPLLSNFNSGLESQTFAMLLERAVEQTLLRPIEWNSLLNNLQICLRDNNVDQFSIIPVGTTADHLICTALKQTDLRHLAPSLTRPIESAGTSSDPASKKPKLAIVGMSGRFPSANDTEQFWDLLYQGLDVHSPVPESHWNSKTHVDPTGTSKNTSATPFGCWLDDPAAFDARFFNISPREAPQIDPAQRIALMTAYEAIEQAGMVPNATPSTRPDRVGVFFGVTSNDWMETNSAQAIDTYFIPGGNRAFIPGRINYYFFKFSGPSYAVDTACSSSLAGIHLVCNSLWRGDIDTAIAGGTNILTNPDFTVGLDRGHFLSRTGNCKTFDDTADGYCRGEGVATLIIKRLDDALAENDPILGIILGAYTNHSAESESITRPHVGAQRAIFSKILSESAVDPNTVSYIEMHETTQYPIVVSAKNGKSLQGNISSMLAYLDKNVHTSLEELSYTTTARRIHHQHRVLVNGSTVQDVRTKLKKAILDNTGMNRPKSTLSVMFTFTGQGAQYAGMGKHLFGGSSLVRKELRQLDQIGRSLGFASILPVILNDEQVIESFAPSAVQLASVCLQMALTRLWASWNIRPSAVVGHSLGEYAALNAAGVLSDTDTIFLVGRRAQLLEEKCTRDTNAMLVVKASDDEIAVVLRGQSYETTCINSPIETVIAGAVENVDSLKELLTAAGLKSTLLKVPYAFHSSQMNPILADLVQLAGGVKFAEPQIPVVCPLDGTIVREGGKFDPQYLVQHTRKPVNMYRALEEARNGRIITDRSLLLEIGPHAAVTGMVKSTMQRGRQSWDIISTTLKSLYEGGADIDWKQYQRDFPDSHQVVSLPAYSWDLKDYWIQYVNDWSLRKGDPPLVLSGPSRLESTTVHTVIEESGDASSTKLIVEADIARKDLSPLVQGHEVDGIPLCTPSVYADMALTVGTYLQQRYRASLDEDLVDVADMVISKALILQEGATKQPLQAHIDANRESNSASVKFLSFDKKGQLQEHARCQLCFRDCSRQQKSLQKDAAGIKDRMQALRDGIATGATARFNRPMVYRAIRPLARFHDDYRAIDEVVLNSQTLEASSRVSFGSVKREGQFHTHPAIIDSLTQSCGFTMNCNDDTDLDVEVFMNHGWGSLQLFEPIDFAKTYTTYTRMQPGPDKLWYGDVHVFDGEKVVAFFEQIAIQGVPRRVLKVILSIERGKNSQDKKPTPVPRSQVVASASITALVPTQRPTQTAEVPQSSTFNAALAIIAEESGIAMQDFTEATSFADVGIDSLLGLTISARFKEELEVDMDFNALFYEYPTVNDLQLLLKGPGDDVSTTSSSEHDGSPSKTPLTNPTTRSDTPQSIDFAIVVSVIAEETGVSRNDLTDDALLADCGVDSLLSLVIASRLQDAFETEVQHESIFLECQTVGDIKQMLKRAMNVDIEPVPASQQEPLLVSNAVRHVARQEKTPSFPHLNQDDLASRRTAVDVLVEKYTKGFTLPSPSPSGTPYLDDAKVVLVTGTTGSLGSHLVYSLAQLPDVKTVVCLNRENRDEPVSRQAKAMREKGIRFPEALKSKLLVLQADTSKPRLGLHQKRYEDLTVSVTHLIHNAWPMSAKRPLLGFESQFQVFRNLIQFAADTILRHSGAFKFSFQMVSSIGVVGFYGLDGPDADKEQIVVPEQSANITSVLTNGYAEAKWGCERMLEQTLQKHPEHFRAMIVRLGQIAGSKTSGYWNPMEHFGFLIKSSQTLSALPDVDGTLYWTAVNDIADTLCDLVLSQNTPHSFYHIDNPVGQQWRDANTVLADALQVPNLVPMEDWIERVRTAPQQDNPAVLLADFLASNYRRMSCGGLVLDVKNTLMHSKSLCAVGPVPDIVLRKYIHI